MSCSAFTVRSPASIATASQNTAPELCDPQSKHLLIARLPDLKYRLAAKGLVLSSQSREPRTSRSRQLEPMNLHNFRSHRIRSTTRYHLSDAAHNRALMPLERNRSSHTGFLDLPPWRQERPATSIS